MPHVIRLRGPWDYRPLVRLLRGDAGTLVEDLKSLPPAGRQSMPGDWGEALGRDFRGTVRYTRGFSCPTGLTDRDRLLLVVEAVDLEATIHLDETLLGSLHLGEPPARFDLTGLSDGRHVLTVEVTLPPFAEHEEAQRRPSRADQPGGLIGEVLLEIHSPGGDL